MHATQPQLAQPTWLSHTASWLTPRRVRAQAILLALCLWGVCAADFSSHGLFDRANNLKFQDFIPFYVSAQMVAQGRVAELYNQQVIANEIRAIVAQPTNVDLPYLYGPQVALFFTPLTRFSFPAAARIWTTLSLLIYFACIYAIWKSCPNLRPYSALIVLCAIAFPPLFHFFVRGQIAALPLACFTAAFLAFKADRPALAGIALGLLIFKPQFLVAIPLILLFSAAWRAFAGLVLSAAAQLACTWIYFGSSVMRNYLDMLTHISRWITSAELDHAEVQMHSLRAFWSLLIPWPNAAIALYALTSILVIALAAKLWLSSQSQPLHFSALVLAAVLVNPHLFVYDLLVLAPVLLLLADWAITDDNPAHLRVLLYLAFILPLLGPLAFFTHLQLSVPVFAALLWLLPRLNETPGHISSVP